MKKKFIRVMLLGALTLATSVSFVGCKDYDDDISGLREKVDANSKAISEIDAAMKAGKFVVSYNAIPGGYELKLSDGSSLKITNGKDGANGTDGVNGLPGLDGKPGNTVIPKFSVSDDNFWQVSTDDGKTFVFVTDALGNKVKATGANGSDASANVTINSDGFIVIGGVVTTLKQDTKTPSIAIDLVDGLYIITLDGVQYKMLAEGSAYNGLQSVTYRRTSPDDVSDYVQAITLVGQDDAGEDLVLAQSTGIATFKVWPQTMDLMKAEFNFTDTYKTRAVVPALTYIAESAKWLDKGILSIAVQPSDMEIGSSYASSLDITYNGHTTASDYFNFKNVRWTPAQLSFVHTNDSVSVPATFLVDNLANATMPDYSFVYDKSYSLNDSVALGNGTDEYFKSMTDLGFSGIKAEFAQTEGKAKGIFEVKEGVVTVIAKDQSSAINEVCFITATYKNAAGIVISTYDFAVKAVRQSIPQPALVDIPLKAMKVADLTNLSYSATAQDIKLDVRSFLDLLGGRDYMANNQITTPRIFDLYYVTVKDGKTFANKANMTITYTPGTSTDKDEMYLNVASGAIIEGTQTLLSYNYWPFGADVVDITNNSMSNSWRESRTTLAVNGANKNFTMKLDGVKCERKVIIKQNSAFVVNNATTIVGKWNETAKSFTMTANLEDLYGAYKSDGTTTSPEDITYSLAAKANQSEAVQAIYDQIAINNNEIIVSPVVNLKTLGAIKIEAKITGTDIKATIVNIAGTSAYCEPVLRSPLAALTATNPDKTWVIDGASNSTYNVASMAKVAMLDRDINVTTKNSVVKDGVLVNPWAAAYNVNTLEYSIAGYSKTINEGTFSINKATGVITCNNFAIVSQLDIYVKVSLKHNWGTEVIEQIVVKAALN